MSIDYDNEPVIIAKRLQPLIENYPFDMVTDTGGEWLTQTMKKTEKGDNGCLIWKGSTWRKSSKQGLIVIKGQRYSVHRFMYQYFNPGIKLNNYNIKQSCKNTSCINIDHFALTKRVPKKTGFNCTIDKIEDLDKQKFPTFQHKLCVKFTCAGNRHVERLNLLPRIIKGVLQLTARQASQMSSLEFTQRFNIPEGLFA